MCVWKRWRDTRWYPELPYCFSRSQDAESEPKSIYVTFPSTLMTIVWGCFILPRICVIVSDSEMLFKVVFSGRRECVIYFSRCVCPYLPSTKWRNEGTKNLYNCTAIQHAKHSTGKCGWYKRIFTPKGKKLPTRSIKDEKCYHPFLLYNTSSTHASIYLNRWVQFKWYLDKFTLFLRDWKCYVIGDISQTSPDVKKTHTL